MFFFLFTLLLLYAFLTIFNGLQKAIFRILMRSKHMKLDLRILFFSLEFTTKELKTILLNKVK